MIDDRRADRELAVEHRGRRRRDPGFLDVDDDIAVDLVGVGGAIAKADDIELNRRQQFQPRLGQDSRFQISGERTGARDHRAELFGAVGLQREPGLERPKAARQIGPEIARPGRARGEAPGFPAQIGRRRGKRLAMPLAVANDQEAGVIGHLSPFVEIERD